MTAIPEPVQPGRDATGWPLVDRAANRAKRALSGAPKHRGDPNATVPQVQFSSYYGRGIVKPAPWSHEIPAYLYLGGLAAGSGFVATGGHLAGQVELQRNARLVALGAVGASTYCLIADLGKPSRFLNMMRTVKLTSPMSVGTWIFSAYAAFTGAAAACDLVERYVDPEGDTLLGRVAPLAGRLAGLGAGAFAAPLASYTAVLLSNTATPTWHAGFRELPFVFVGSGLSSAGGAAMITTRPAQTGAARWLAVGGSAIELVAESVLEKRIGLPGETLHTGSAGSKLRAAKALTVAGSVVAAVGGRWRAPAVVAGLALNVASALTRFAVFEAGIASAKDPKYTVVPQKERLERRRAQEVRDRR